MNGRDIPSRVELGEEITKALRAAGHAFGDETVAALATHLELLYRWNQRVNLTAIRNPRIGIVRHLLESLDARQLFEPRAQDHLVDIGSGNGYPALALLSVWRDIRGTLIEKTARKVDFLRAVLRELGFGERVAVLERRVEEARELPADATVITLRAAPDPERWIQEALALPSVRCVMAWLSDADAAPIALSAQGRGAVARTLPLSTHPGACILCVTRA